MRVLLIVVLAAFSTACASTGATPRPFPGPRPTAPGPRVPTDASPVPGTAVTETALALRGIPYRNGGADLNGFDCSGFVWYVFAQHGLAMPRTVAEQYEVGGKVTLEAVQAGDLVFFRTAGRGVSHVGIAVGDGGFVHAPSSTGVVRVERLSASYWSERYLGARRP
jgi:cell wall-associated NlpC family hydrolase